MVRYVGIDPSTKTGFVALNAEGEVLVASEVTGIGDVDPRRIATMIDRINLRLYQNDICAIEDIPKALNSPNSAMQAGIGYLIRDRLFRKSLQTIEVNVQWVKMWCGIEVFEGISKKDGGDGKKRKKSIVVKKEIIKYCAEHYGFITKSDNIADAYIIAQICRTFHTNDIIGITDKQMAVIEKIERGD